MHRNAVAFSRERAAQFNEWAGETLDIIVPALGLTPGQAVADIGAGGGAFTLAFANEIGPSGAVYAIDSYPEMLDYVAEYIAGHQTAATAPLHTLLLPHSGEGLPDRAFDLVFMRQVYHHLDSPAEYLARVWRAIRSGGRLAVIDFIPGSGHGPAGHAVSEDEIRRTAESVGFEFDRRLDILTEHGRSFTIYRVPVEGAERPPVQ